MADAAPNENDTPKVEAATGVAEKSVDKPEASETTTSTTAAPAETSTDSATPASAVKDEAAKEDAAAEPAAEPAAETAKDKEPAVEEKKDKAAVEPAAEPVKKEEPVAEEKKAEAAETAEKAESKPEAHADGAAAAAPVPTKEADKEAAPKKTPLDEFDAKLPEILKEIGHDEMWGVTLVTPASSHVPTAIVLQKFLNANDGNLPQAIDQLKGALKFRKEKKPLELLTKKFSANKFADLGAVTVYPVKDSAAPEVFTWNLYGNVKGKMDEVFVPLDEYVKLRFKPPRDVRGSYRNTDRHAQIHGLPYRPARAGHPAAEADLRHRAHHRREGSLQDHPGA